MMGLVHGRVVWQNRKTAYSMAEGSCEPLKEVGGRCSTCLGLHPTAFHLPASNLAVTSSAV